MPTLDDADAELRAMARYFLAPDPAPHSAHAPQDRENSSPNRGAASKAVAAPKPAALKKQQRNERDRQRSLAKRVGGSFNVFF
jgi:hypothetical protein